MHRVIAGVTILEHELSELRLLVERLTGVLLDCPNSALAAHVAEHLESHELESPAALLNRLRSCDLDPAEVAEFLDGVMNMKTGFYRHPGAMNALARHVMPQLYSRKADDGACTVRIWSAGCATGEEPYSIAMAICEAMPNGSSSAGNGSCNGNGGPKSTGRNGGVLDTGAPGMKEWSIHIVGTDLLPSAVKVAERGLYPQSALQGLPPAMIRSCFSKIGANASSNPLEGTQNGSSGNGNSTSSSPNCTHLLVKPRVRSLVTFNTMNLTRPVYIGRFDCIFCMDVLPQLSRSQRSALIERLHLYLEPGGYLFLSQTEKLCAPNLNFRQETYDGYTMHRKPMAASAAYGR
ncbi:MAG TPA: CheR family methyltransferase [Candidatus Binatia bacterium]|nr:CheR family methyltransferase [Candidatus Sulfotelmatobacter sp.]HXJ86788.1 CheR family methyltransferase [Candidatus Binatia bacterium]